MTRMNYNTLFLVISVTVLSLGLIFNVPYVVFYGFGASILALGIIFFSIDVLILTLILIRPSLDILGDITIPVALDFPQLNIAGVVALISIVLSWIITAQRTSSLRSIPLFWPLTIFMGTYILFVFGANNPQQAIEEVVRVFSFVSIYFAGYVLVNNWQDVKMIIGAFIISSIVPVLVGLFQLITEQGLYTNPGFDNRIAGTFGHPNVLGYYLLIIIVFISYSLVQNIERKKEKLLLSLYSLLIIIVLINTYTRGAWIGSFFFLGGVCFVQYPKKTLQAGGALVPLTSISLFLYNWLQSEVFFTWPRLAGIPIVSRILGLFSADPSDSILWRMQMWQDMFTKALERPFRGFGTGMDTTMVESVRGISLGSLEVHNDYLKLFLEMGIWGPLVFLGVGAATFWILIRHLRSRHDHLVLMLIFLTFVIYFSSGYDNILRQTAVMWMYFTFLGVGMKSITQIRSQSFSNSKFH